MDRREFIKVAGVTGLAASLPGTMTFAQNGKKDGTRPTLVVIYLRGGMDAINAVVPWNDPRYYDIRPTIAIPDPDDTDGGVIDLDGTFGLHKNLGALKPWWDSGKLGIIMNVGSPHPTRSHFDAQDFMEYAAPGIRGMRNGWLNRYLQLTQEDADKTQQSEDRIRAIAMQGLLPRALRGDMPVLAVPEKKVLNKERVFDAFKDIYGCKEMTMTRKDDDPVIETGQNTLEILEVYNKLLSGSKERKVKYPDSRLGKKLRDIASVIHAGAELEVACVDYGGWDHHANEGSTYGTIAKMLKDLADSMHAFGTDLGKRMDNTLVLTMTEFGRTCKENGNTGTDHGHGGSMFLMGGGIKGGKVHGKWLGLEDKVLYKERDLPVTTDFRDVFATVLSDHMDFDLPRKFFPEYQPRRFKGLF
jgi:uncharacterized protein (DUF1501 family)